MTKAKKEYLYECRLYGDKANAEQSSHQHAVRVQPPRFQQPLASRVWDSSCPQPRALASMTIYGFRLHCFMSWCCLPLNDTYVVSSVQHPIPIGLSRPCTVYGVHWGPSTLYSQGVCPSALVSGQITFGQNCRAAKPDICGKGSPCVLS